MVRLALVIAAIAAAQTAVAPTVDGRIDDAEWTGATTAGMSGGGEVRVLRRGEFVYVAVRGPRAGLASLCAAKGSTVRILHASAAVGEATYERDGDTWKQRSGFAFTLRDAPRGGRPTAAESAEYLRTSGWVANASAAGSPDREFQIRAADLESLGVTFLSTSEPMALSYWPAAMADDCRSTRMAQGYLSPTASFAPSAWHPVPSR